MLAATAPVKRSQVNLHSLLTCMSCCSIHGRGQVVGFQLVFELLNLLVSLVSLILHEGDGLVQLILVLLMMTSHAHTHTLAQSLAGQSLLTHAKLLLNSSNFFL